MRVLILGGLGFQGSHLADAWLAAGHDVSVLNTPSDFARENARVLLGAREKSASIIWGSVSDFEIVDKAMISKDTVVHLAAWSSVDASLDEPGRSFGINALGTYNVLEAARRRGCTVIAISSCEVYGSVRQYGDEQSEDYPCTPASPYAAGKLAGDRLAIAYYHAFKLPVTVLRPCNVFGPRQKLGAHGAVIPIFVKQALDKQCLRVRGDGEQTREWISITDLVRAYTLVLNAHEAWDQYGSGAVDPVMGEVFNIGTGTGFRVSVLDIAKECARSIGGYVTHVAGREGEIDRFALDSTKFRQRFSWEPTTTFWYAFGQYVAWAEREHAAVHL